MNFKFIYLTHQNRGELENYNIIESVKNKFKIKQSSDVYINNRKQKGTIGLMCPFCFNTKITEIEFKNYNSIRRNNKDKFKISLNISIKSECDICKQYCDWIEIDVNLLETIKTLNEKGFKTKYCCEGHRNSIGYISFEDSDILKYIDTLPITWFFDFEDYKNIKMYRYNRKKVCIIRSDACNYRESLMDILEWAQNLPYSFRK